MDPWLQLSRTILLEIVLFKQRLGSGLGTVFIRVQWIRILCGKAKEITKKFKNSAVRNFWAAFRLLLKLATNNYQTVMDQCSGSGFIESGSGILGWIPIRIWGFYDQKFKKLALSLGLQQGGLSYRRILQPSKVNIQPSKTWNVSVFFLTIKGWFFLPKKSTVIKDFAKNYPGKGVPVLFSRNF